MPSNPTPWRVKLWMKCSPTMVEVYDANGIAVLPWTAFDHLMSLRKKRQLAARIVRAVNKEQQ